MQAFGSARRTSSPARAAFDDRPTANKATMQILDKPENEATRVDTLRKLNILDTEPEERFDRLPRLAKRLFGVPIALVSLVDVNRQWFKSCFGLDVTTDMKSVQGIE